MYRCYMLVSSNMLHAIYYFNYHIEYRIACRVMMRCSRTRYGIGQRGRTAGARSGKKCQATGRF